MAETVLVQFWKVERCAKKTYSFICYGAYLPVIVETLLPSDQRFQVIAWL
jgi:hypothetical protein